MTSRTFHVGLLYLNSLFGEDLLKRLNQVEPFYNQKKERISIRAEHLWIQEADLQYHPKYHLIIDRISHLLKQTCGLLMNYAFSGVHIVNNPLSFHYFMAHKDVGYFLARSLGIPIPKTIALPTHFTPQLTIEDFKYHRHWDWKALIEQIQLPCILKPAAGRAGQDVHLVRNLEELITLYKNSGNKVMLLQETVKSPYNWQLRCLCIGKKIIIFKYRFGQYDTSQYITNESFLPPEQEKAVIHHCRILNRIHGYEMNSVEFILDHQGVPWAIDFNNPIPDGRREALGDDFYQDYQEALVDFVKQVAYEQKPSYFLPDLNPYSRIAQMSCSLEEKYKLALQEANLYYLADGPA